MSNPKTKRSKTSHSTRPGGKAEKIKGPRPSTTKPKASAPPPARVSTPIPVGSSRRPDVRRPRSVWDRLDSWLSERDHRPKLVVKTNKPAAGRDRNPNDRLRRIPAVKAPDHHVRRPGGPPASIAGAHRPPAQIPHGVPSRAVVTPISPKAVSQALTKTITSDVRGLALAKLGHLGFEHAGTPLNEPSTFVHGRPQFGTRSVGGQEVLTIRNNSFIGPVVIAPIEVIPGTGAVNDIVPYEISPVNSDLFPEYIRDISTIFTYYKVLHLRIRWNPAVSASTDGTLAFAYVADPTLPAPTNLRDLMNITGSKMFKAYEEGDYRVPLESQQGPDGLYSVGNGVNITDNSTQYLSQDFLDDRLGADPRLSIMGRVYVCTSNFNVVSLLPHTIGNLTMDWAIEYVGIAPRDNNTSCSVCVNTPSTTTWAPAAGEGLSWLTPPNGVSVRAVTPYEPVVTKGLALQFSKPGFFRVQIRAWGTGFGAAGNYGPMPGAGVPGAVVADPAWPISVATLWQWAASSTSAGVNTYTYPANRDATVMEAGFYVRVVDDDYAFLLGPNVSTATAISLLQIDVLEVDEFSIGSQVGSPSTNVAPEWRAADVSSVA